MKYFPAARKLFARNPFSGKTGSAGLFEISILKRFLKALKGGMEALPYHFTFFVFRARLRPFLRFQRGGIYA